MQNAEVTSPVLIVGGGPFGLMCSIELSRRGIASYLVDADLGTARNPQANATQARTMEHFRRLGFSEEIRQAGLPHDYPTDIAYFTRYVGHELARFALPASRDATTAIKSLSGSWSAAELPHRVSQKFVEQVLRRHAEAGPLASLNFGCRLEEFTQVGDKVSASVTDVASGERRSITADYLIGGDGARSAIRKALGISLAGETGVTRDFFGGKMVAVYLRAPDFYATVPHGKAWMYVAFNPQRRSWLAAVNGVDEFALHTQLKPGEDQTISAERGKELFAQVTGRAIDIEVLAVDTWTAGHALVADRFRDGKVFIGGDAAHLFTPAGGLGYNTAVEDAVNLCWKLAATLNGTAGPDLLDSYEIERRKLAIRNTDYARQLADSLGCFVPGPAIETDTAEGEAARAHAGTYLNAHARREFNIPGITFGGRYDGSPVIVPDGETPPVDAMDVYVPSAVPGGRVPHFWLEDGRSLFDLFGFDWTLLAIDADAGDVAAFRTASADRGIALELVEIAMPEAKALFGAKLVLIRPDQIIAWRQTEAPVDPVAVFDAVLGGAVHHAIAAGPLCGAA
ncbi:2-polyprenyl-6-methoxyphenol hydroxylase-like FAD-dependent oxidoreductase [Sphingomonas vulcanisoli]|uniref:2-polyprenyl-6-methoxyphenol hydroxylase-like FAD-dependent oxidoreductase n=1 Tax=Sphingomonas vulcanisoli TaxID=1658060 RepID=A0ABX0TZ35_9SPHN|nr:FAD-dependent oxidoreductase [Sphingomonas vulcanisoli]NIJ09630.1 2-polyprenyl-6-methoxyphenol hydroxylase-like FAD-dependent oxidoreductase [Sphingomonas vulcanisoli]